MNAHGLTNCGCSDCHVELLALQEELDELERTDPEVGAAAESYDRMVERVTGRSMPCLACQPADGRDPLKCKRLTTCPLRILARNTEADR